MRLAVIRAATSPQDISEGSFMASLLVSFLWVADWLLEAAGGVHKGEICTGLGSTAEGVIHRRKPNERKSGGLKEPVLNLFLFRFVDFCCIMYNQEHISTAKNQQVKGLML